MYKINKKVLTEIPVKELGLTVYQCDSVNPWEDTMLHVGNVRIIVWGSERARAHFKRKGFDAWLNYRCDLEKKKLHNQIEFLFEKQAALDATGKWLDFVIKWT